MKLSESPRVRMAALPTPLQFLTNLSQRLGGPRIWVKRDDLTGVAFGGNKARKLEYILGDAKAQGAQSLVTGAGFHSNWCTQTAAAAKKLGMEVYLVKTAPRDGFDMPWDGNHLLHHLVGAHVETVEPQRFQEALEATVKRLEEEGLKPYFIPVGGSNHVGARAYVNCVLELQYQADQLGVHFKSLYHATGSGGTQAGLVAGVKALNTGTQVVGAAVGWVEKEQQVEKVRRIVEATKEDLGLEFQLGEGDIQVFNEYVGGGYGHLTPAKLEAVRIMAETEGIMLDPVYTATAMACLIDHIRKGVYTKEDNVVFLHTGGAVALFPYREPLEAYLRGEPIPWSKPPWSPN